MDQRRIDSLSPQQRRCLVLVGKGRTSPEIAYELGIAEGTVNGHIAAGLSKLGARSRRAAGFAVLQAEMLLHTPQEIPGINLSVDEMTVDAPQPLSNTLREAAADPFCGIDRTPTLQGSEQVENSHAVLIKNLTIIALIISIAALFVLFLANYPAVIATAKDIYNTMPPSNVTAN